MTDPYEILGVAKTAPQDEIKKSYRKLAKKYHPDMNPGDKEAEKKFKSVSHAFDLIGTPESRAKFDRGETDEQQQRQYEEFVKNQGKGGSRSYYNPFEGGEDHFSFSFGDEMGGEDLFENLFGSSRRGRARGTNYPGEDVIYKMDVEFKEAALGAERVITLPNGKNLKVKIPAGIESGKKLRFKGQGSLGTGKGAPGDAYVEIQVRPLDGFKRVGNDIEVEVPVSFIEAITGAEIKVPTIDGEVMVNIPAGVSTGSKLRVKGKGAGEGNSRGNQIVILKVVTPKVVDPALRSAVEALKGQFNYNPRSA